MFDENSRSSSKQNLHLGTTLALSKRLSTRPKIDSRAVTDILKAKAMNMVDYDSEDPFYVADLAQVMRQYNEWKELLPRVSPFYAVKCCPDEMIIKTLYDLGSGFDCASKGEIQMALETGISPANIIFANPCKQVSHIRFAASVGVSMMTFDNEDELHKIKMHFAGAKMILRILTDDSKSRCRFGVKFGASLKIVPKLLETAKELGINVVGVSFHVGSGCGDASAYRDAVVLAREAFDIGQRLGFNFSILDIGGGFPGRGIGTLQFPEIARTIRSTLDELFPQNIRIIAEPGRYMASNCFTLAVNIIARRVVPSPDGEGRVFMYYINDGMYGSFNCITFDHATVTPKPLVQGGVFCYNQTDSADFSCSIWGPTCDSIDCIGRDMRLPEMNVGDFLVFENMGAYTVAAASSFNGFKQTSIHYTNSRNPV